MHPHTVFERPWPRTVYAQFYIKNQKISGSRGAQRQGVDSESFAMGSLGRRRELARDQAVTNRKAAEASSAGQLFGQMFLQKTEIVAKSKLARLHCMSPQMAQEAWNSNGKSNPNRSPLHL